MFGLDFEEKRVVLVLQRRMDLDGLSSHSSVVHLAFVRGVAPEYLDTALVMAVGPTIARGRSASDRKYGSVLASNGIVVQSGSRAGKEGRLSFGIDQNKEDTRHDSVCSPFGGANLVL